MKQFEEQLQINEFSSIPFKESQVSHFALPVTSNKLGRATSIERIPKNKPHTHICVHSSQYIQYADTHRRI